jgi:hypothetical protein
MDVKLVINCQYFENYNVGPEGFGEVPHWKPKGGHEFEIEVDSDVLLYSNKLEEHLTTLVEGESTIAEKFEYRGHELKWSDPSTIKNGKNRLYKLITNEDE